MFAASRTRSRSAELAQRSIIENLKALTHPDLVKQLQDDYIASEREIERLKAELKHLQYDKGHQRRLLDARPVLEMVSARWNEVAPEDRRELFEAFAQHAIVNRPNRVTRCVTVVWRDGSRTSRTGTRDGNYTYPWTEAERARLYEMVTNRASQIELLRAFPGANWRMIRERYAYHFGNPSWRSIYRRSQTKYGPYTRWQDTDEFRAEHGDKAHLQVSTSGSLPFCLPHALLALVGFYLVNHLCRLSDRDSASSSGLNDSQRRDMLDHPLHVARQLVHRRPNPRRVVAHLHEARRVERLRHDHHFSDVGDQFGGIGADDVLTKQRALELRRIAHMIDGKPGGDPQMHHIPRAVQPTAQPGDDLANGDLRQPQPEGVAHRHLIGGATTQTQQFAGRKLCQRQIADEPRTLRRVADALNVNALMLFRMAGYLPPEPNGNSVHAEYLADIFDQLPREKQDAVMGVLEAMSESPSVKAVVQEMRRSNHPLAGMDIQFPALLRELANHLLVKYGITDANHLDNIAPDAQVLNYVWRDLPIETRERVKALIRRKLALSYNSTMVDEEWRG